MMVTWPEVVAGGVERSDVNVIWGKKLKDLGKQDLNNYFIKMME